MLLVLTVSACVPEPRPSPTSSPTPAATEMGPGPGDRRVVIEPQLPVTTCATVSARLAMPDGSASASDESDPPETSRLQQAL
ncbi:hypothetical protein ACUOGV_24215, partial [Escherichia coli]